jgi:hypothetical protein
MFMVEARHAGRLSQNAETTRDKIKPYGGVIMRVFVLFLAGANSEPSLISTISLVISVASVLLSAFALWWIQARPARLKFSYGTPNLYFYYDDCEVHSSSTENKFIVSLMIPISAYNMGSIPAEILDVGLWFDPPVPENRNFFQAFATVNFNEFIKFRRRRNDWVEKARKDGWRAFVVQPHSAETVHLVMEAHEWRIQEWKSRLSVVVYTTDRVVQYETRRWVQQSPSRAYVIGRFPVHIQPQDFNNESPTITQDHRYFGPRRQQFKMQVPDPESEL